jgi:hypothetical protein
MYFSIWLKMDELSSAKILFGGGGGRENHLKETLKHTHTHTQSFTFEITPGIYAHKSYYGPSAIII